MDYAFPHSRFEGLIFRLYRLFFFKRRLKHIGNGAFISPFTTIRGLEYLSIGDNSSIGSGSIVISISHHLENEYEPSITIGNNVYIGHGCTLSTVGKIEIANDTTFGDNVYLGAAQHGYESPNEGVMSQPLVNGSIKIGSKVWIGYGAFITAKDHLEIGEHAIIGANSVVTQSVPAFTIVAGVPARPIKQYNPKTKQWERINQS